MRVLPVSTDTHARAVALQAADNFTTDTLVALALDAYELRRELEVPGSLSNAAPQHDEEWRRRFDECCAGTPWILAVQRPPLRAV